MDKDQRSPKASDYKYVQIVDYLNQDLRMVARVILSLATQYISNRTSLLTCGILRQRTEIGKVTSAIENGSPPSQLSLDWRPPHCNTLSGSRHPESGRQGVPPDASDYSREISDSPNTVESGQKDKEHSDGNPLCRNQPPKDTYSTYQGPEPADNDCVQARRENHGNEFPPGGGPPGGTPNGLEDEPEMLFQPETRPISHEQLVVEVKGIYAGLVIVEAKCIDIDERQSAAAQEKDPSKKTELKNDQWQSLIALHKQV